MSFVTLLVSKIDKRVERWHYNFKTSVQLKLSMRFVGRDGHDNFFDIEIEMMENRFVFVILETMIMTWHDS